jgi:hypothetical protein
MASGKTADPIGAPSTAGGGRGRSRSTDCLYPPRTQPEARREKGSLRKARETALKNASENAPGTAPENAGASFLNVLACRASDRSIGG